MVGPARRVHRAARADPGPAAQRHRRHERRNRGEQRNRGERRTGASGGTGATEGTGAVGGTSGTGGATVCNGTTCAPGQDCCLVSGKCVDPATVAGTCPAPTTPGPQGEKPCAASFQCAPGEYCVPLDAELCLGAGYCTSTANCPASSFQVCGCNGVTYAGIGAACNAGEPYVGIGPCGQETTVGAGGSSAGLTATYCGTNDQCPAGEQCCGITGACYDPSLPALCTEPPPGTLRPCIDDSQCIAGQEYCYADGCDGPGGCVSIPGSGSCNGQLDPACGCDGKSYVNADCAAAAGVRVAHMGQCP